MQNEPLLQQIKDFSQEVGYVSVSAIQRKFMLKYEDAKQLVDTLIQQDFCQADFTAGQGYLIQQNNHAAIKFNPYIGSKYFADNRFGLRILVLGESHYGNSIHYHPEFTTEIVRWLGQEERHAFFTKISNVLLGLNGGWLDNEIRGEIWEHVAFYNYIQEYVGLSARIAPTPELWAAAEQPFLQVIDMLSPQVVLVLGKALATHIPELPEHIKVCCIVHPSSSYFSYSEATPLFTQALDQVKHKIETTSP